MFKRKYRIVRDGYLGYEVQFKPWWLPIWVQAWGEIGPSNTHISLEEAEKFANRHREGNMSVVKMLD